MVADVVVYGLAGLILGIVVWWAFDAWVEVKRLRKAAEEARERYADRAAPPAS